MGFRVYFVLSIVCVYFKGARTQPRKYQTEETFIFCSASLNWTTLRLFVGIFLRGPTFEPWTGLLPGNTFQTRHPPSVSFGRSCNTNTHSCNTKTLLVDLSHATPKRKNTNFDKNLHSFASKGWPNWGAATKSLHDRIAFHPLMYPKEPGALDHIDPPSKFLKRFPMALANCCTTYFKMFGGACNRAICQWIILVLSMGGRDYWIPWKAMYTWYISAVYYQLWDYLVGGFNPSE